MNWTRKNLVTWKHDSGCKVQCVTTADGLIRWIARNSHGSRLQEPCLYYCTYDNAAAAVEKYVADRTDAGLFPYNR